MKKRTGIMAMMTVALMSLVALGVTGCSNEGTTAPDSGSPMTAVYNTFDLMGEPADFYDGTFESPIMERPDPNADRPTHRTPFDMLLRKLHLSERQLAAVKEMMVAHQRCVHAAKMTLRESGSEVIAAAKAAREAIIAKARAGEITREEAATQIRELNKRTREALRNSDARARVREMMKNCDDEFLAKLGSILTEEQAAILREWMAGRDAHDKGTGRDKDKDKGGDRDPSTGTGRGG